MAILQADEISKVYASAKALDMVDVEISEGEIFGLLGPNGAGKTTFIRILNQILSPDTGTIQFHGRELMPHDIYTFGYLPEERGLYKKMRVGEQAVYFASLKGMQPSVAKKELLQWFEKFEISHWWNKRVEELSKGMQQKIQFIITVLHKPQILILDEPFSGFDPINAEHIKQEILEMKKSGTTIILSTHNMSSVEELCDSIALFNAGKKILQGSVFDIKQKHKKNQYHITFQGYFDKFLAALSSSYTILWHEQQENQIDVHIELTEEVETNKLLTHFMNIGTIIGFKEILPSMHDIFLESIHNNSNIAH